MPQDWNIVNLIKLAMKGNLKECKNYRGIALLSVVVKVLNRILLTRLLKAVDEKLREQQAGFRKDRSCTDQIAALRIIIEQSLECNTSLFLNFVDFEKAFNNLDREVLWNLMAHYGIPQKFINIIRNSYNNMQCSHTWRQTNWKFWCQDRSKTRLLVISFSLPPGNWLHHESQLKEKETESNGQCGNNWMT